MLKDLFKKGLDYINDKKDAKAAYNELISNSIELDNLEAYCVNNPDPSIGKEKMILFHGLTVNNQAARMINALIPVFETVLVVKMAKEEKTNRTYYFVITDKKLWVLNETNYKCYDFNSIGEVKIINKSLLSQGVCFDNGAFSFEGNESEINKFIELLVNEEVRSNVISEATNYLCGIIPKKQLLNNFLSGISFGANNHVVLHNKFTDNKLIGLSDIEYMQLLMDNTVVLTKGRNVTNQPSVEGACHKMSIKFVLKDGIFIIDVMPENSFCTLVQKEDTIYQENLTFAKNLMEFVEKTTKENVK